jgi:hypothetical protein
MRDIYRLIRSEKAGEKEHLMDEARRFLRYVVPTLVFLVEVAILLLVTQKGCLIGSVSARLRTGGAGFPALLIVMAGGAGYLFSLIHHTLFWYCGKYGIDYREFLRNALAHGWLRLVTYRQQDGVAQKDDVPEVNVTRIVAWDVIALLWYRPGRAGDAKAPEMGEALVSRSDAISDLMHSLGTSAIAAYFVWPAWVALYFWLCHEPSFGLGLLWKVPLSVFLAGVFIWLHHSNYKRVRDYLVRLVKNVLATHFTHLDEVAVICVDRSALDLDLDTSRNLWGKLWTALRQRVERTCKRGSPSSNGNIHDT